MKKLLFGWFCLMFVLAISHASQEEILHWRSITLDCGTIQKAGKVTLNVTTDDNSFLSFQIEAFGRTHKLSEADLKRLAGFPLDSLRITHEAGYQEIGGHTVHFRFHKVSYDTDKKLREETMLVSVDETHKVTLTGPTLLEKR